MTNPIDRIKATGTVLVYSFRPQRCKAERFAVACGDQPADLLSSHKTREAAEAQANEYAAQTGATVNLDY